jgi:tetratricopeptide (TPR) repeat protein/O-antigen ligase
MKDKQFFVNRLVITLYFLVMFLPSFGAQYHVIAQWFYISLLNVGSIGYIYIKKKDYNLNITNKFTLYVFLGAISFLVISLLSIFKSLLVSESLVTLVYLILTLVALFVFFIFIKQNPKKYFIFFSFLIVIIGLIESLEVIKYFISQNNEPRNEKIFGSLKSYYGNRNILAVGLAMKFPFVVYLFLTYKNILKYLSLIILMFLFMSILLVGARTAIFSSFILFILILFYVFIAKKRYLETLKNIVLPLIVVLAFSLFASLNFSKIEKGKLNSFSDLVAITSKKNIKQKKVAKETIEKAPDKARGLLNGSGRGLLWITAVDDFKSNPFLGVGIGNWKFMPKGETIKRHRGKSYLYIRKVHNDFLQVLAEIGIVGFLIYSTFFILIFFSLIKTILKNIKKGNEENEFVHITLLASVGIYTFDSFFNFPHERAPIQIFSFFVLGLVLCFLPKNRAINFNRKLVFPFLFLLSLGFLFVSFKVYDTSKINNILYSTIIGKDISKDKYSISYNQMLNMLPDFPEVVGEGRVSELTKFFFAYNSKEKEKALAHLDKAVKMSPYSAEPFGLKAFVYFQDKKLKNLDSALFYAKKAFNIQPGKRENTLILRRIYASRKDTINLIKILNGYTKVVKNDVDAWIQKANLYSVTKGHTRFLKIIDSAYALNPTNELLKGYPRTNIGLIKKHYYLGIELFNQKKHKEAREEFYKVLKLDENNMASLINLGVLERILKNYNQSIEHLSRVIDANFMKNGKPEFNRSLCYYKLEDYKKALIDAKISKSKGYKSSQKLINGIRKNLK